MNKPISTIIGTLICLTPALITGCKKGNSEDRELVENHDGYWVAKIDNPELPVPITVINDMHIDAATNHVTVYAQMKVLGQVTSPPQVNPGECTQTHSGDTVCFHPDAVYLNGSGKELEEADGTGAWWVKHAWVLGGEGYINCDLRPKEEYNECIYAEGILLEDGLTMKIGGTGLNESYYNTRRPLLDEHPITYEVARYEPANIDPEAGAIDLTPTHQFTLNFECKWKASAFDNRVRPCP